MNVYSRDKNGPSCSGAPATYITRPSPSSKEVTLTVCALEISSVHWANHSALFCEMPSLRLLWRSSKPTPETRSPPAVLDHESGTFPASHEGQENN